MGHQRNAGYTPQALVVLVINTPLAYDEEVRFEWDSQKSRANLRKHGISLEEAAELFDVRDDLVLELYDFEHSHDEDRIISIGPIRRGTIVVVSVERNEGETTRLISARFATSMEQQRYNEIIGEENHE